jgi:chemotaxis protein methyltransferase CheR
MAHSVELKTATFRLLQEFVYEHSGIRISNDQIRHLERRLWPVCETVGVDSFEELYNHAKYHARGRQTVESMIEALTTHETYFYREPFQFELLIDEIFTPRLLQRRKIRVLSAGCSSGEELVSLAILLHEAGLENYSFEFVGVDISAEIIKKARSGIYKESSFRACPSHWMTQYFEPIDEYNWKLIHHFQERMEFIQMNLLDSFRFRLLGEFDVIFCRNVMIYFDAASKKELIELFYRRLVVGGYLFLGHAENLISLDTPFVLQHFQNDMIYQKVQRVD